MSNLDLVSQRINFYMKDYKNFHTNVGIFLSLTVCLLIASSGIYFAITFMSIGKPYVIQSLIQQLELSFKSFDKVPIGFRLTDDLGVPINPEGIFTIQSTWIKTHKNEGTLIQEYQDIPSVKCDLEKSIPQEFRSVASIESLNTFYCSDWPKDQEFSLDNLYGGTFPYTFKGTRFFQCNTSDESINCESQKGIDTLLMSSFLEILTIDYNIQSLQLVPVVPKLNIYRTPISNTSYLRVWMSLMQGEYSTDSGIIFENKETLSYHIFTVLKEQFRAINKVDVENGIAEFASFTIQNNETISYYLRSFTKIQDAFANFGGITKALLVLAQIGNYILNRKEYWCQLESMLPISVPLQNESLDISIAQQQNQPILKNSFFPSPKADIKNLKSKISSELKLSIFERILPDSCINTKRKKQFHQNINLLKEIFSAKSIIEVYSKTQELKRKTLLQDEGNMFNLLHSAYEVSNQDKNLRPQIAKSHMK